MHVPCAVQELMWRGTDPLVVLRLLVLLSYVGNGLPKKHAGVSQGVGVHVRGRRRQTLTLNLQQGSL